MDKKAQMAVFYGAIMVACVLALFTVRWMSYKTPKVEVSVEQYDVEKGDSLLMKYNAKFEDDQYYYGIDSIFTTTSAGTFPFLETRIVTRSSRWSRPVWNEN